MSSLGGATGAGGGFADLFSKGLEAWVDVERVRAYRPNDPTPGTYGPTQYGTAGQGNYESPMASSPFPVGLVLVGVAAVVLLLLIRKG